MDYPLTWQIVSLLENERKIPFIFGESSGLLLIKEKGLLTPTMGKCYI